MSERSDRDVRHSPFRLQKDRNKSVLLQRRPGFYVCHYIRSVRVRARDRGLFKCPFSPPPPRKKISWGTPNPPPAGAGPPPTPPISTAWSYASALRPSRL